MKMLVSMTDLTKYNGEKCILDRIELHIEDKDKVGILSKRYPYQLFASNASL